MKLFKLQDYKVCYLNYYMYFKLNINPSIFNLKYNIKQIE